MDSAPLSVLRVGYWSAIAAATLSISYDVGQLAEWIGWMGSGGGPENASTVLGLVVLLTPSLFLGIAFLLMMLAVHYFTPLANKIWSMAGLAFAIIYITLISINYFVQLTLVVPHLLRGDTSGISFLLFKPFDSFLYSVDILGYSFMSLSTLFTAFAFGTRGQERIVRLFFIANGLLLPFIALQNYCHPLIWIAAAWAVTFPGGALAVAILLKSRMTSSTNLV